VAVPRKLDVCSESAQVIQSAQSMSALLSSCADRQRQPGLATGFNANAHAEAATNDHPHQ
jgi:hypothetical protein